MVVSTPLNDQTGAERTGLTPKVSVIKTSALLLSVEKRACFYTMQAKVYFFNKNAVFTVQ